MIVDETPAVVTDLITFTPLTPVLLNLPGMVTLVEETPVDGAEIQVEEETPADVTPVEEETRVDVEGIRVEVDVTLVVEAGIKVKKTLNNFD